MTPEAIGIGFLIKLILGGVASSFIAFFFYVFRMNHIRLQNTPTQGEVQKLIDEKFELLQTDLGGKIDQLLTASSEGTLQRKKTNETLTQIDKKLAVFENDMEYIKKEVNGVNADIINLRDKVDSISRH